MIVRTSSIDPEAVRVAGSRGPCEPMVVGRGWNARASFLPRLSRLSVNKPCVVAGGCLIKSSCIVEGLPETSPKTPVVAAVAGMEGLPERNGECMGALGSVNPFDSSTPDQELETAVASRARCDVY